MALRITPAPAPSGAHQDPVLALRPAPHVALLLGDLRGGGVQRMTMILAEGLAARGMRVDLVVCEARGHLKTRIPDAIRLISLERSNSFGARLAALRADWRGAGSLIRALATKRHRSKTLAFLPSLTRYLRARRPDSLFAATSHLNIEAVLARRLAGVRTRLVISERSHFSSGKPRKEWRLRNLSAAMRRTYLQADAITAVSDGVAEDVARSIGIPREVIITLHNPAITPDFESRARQTADHPWLIGNGPPVLVAVGRVAYQKDYPTLLRAFARVKRHRPVRLIIIGDGSAKQIQYLRKLIVDLGVEAHVDLIGYRANPLPYMAHAKMLVLSSCYEGFGNVVLEALACGTPVVSTDCPSGPREILAGGAYGPLVPVGDDAALAAAIDATLDRPPEPASLKARAAVFDYESAIDGYAALLLGDLPEVQGSHSEIRLRPVPPIATDEMAVS